MNVVYTTYQTAYQNPGGGEIQLLKTINAIRNGNYSCKVNKFEPFETRIENHDVLHAFSSHPDNETTISWAADHNVPTALSTIYWEPMEFFHKSSGLKKYIKIAEEWGKRATRKLGITYFDTQKRLYEKADILLPNSKAEAELIASKFDIDSKKFHIVPNAVDSRFSEADAEPFVDKYGFEDFILFVGVLSHRKNLVQALTALRDLDRDVIVVGPAGDESYARKCREVAGTNVSFIGKFDHDDPMLASAYAASEVFVLPSWYETPGLAALEAGLAGSKIAVTDRGSTQEYFLDYVNYLNPADPDSIRSAVESALTRDYSIELRNRIMDRYTWDVAAEETMTAYRSII